MHIGFLTAKPNINNKVGTHTFVTTEKRPPTGLGYLYKIVTQAGYTCEIIDRYAGLNVSDLSKFDFIGIYSASVCIDDVKEIITKNKDKQIAVGGPHWHVFPKDIDLFKNTVNYFVLGEAENIIIDLIQNNISTQVIKTDRLYNSELDLLPRFPYEYFYLEPNRKLYNWSFPFKNIQPVFTMNTSRGCPFECTFCSVKKIWGNKYTYMSAERIIEDIQYLIYEFNIKGIYFREDNFTLNNNRVLNFCNLLLKKNIQIEWACETRVDTVPEDLMQLMATAGCIGFYVGVEHGSEKMLKLFNKKITSDQIISFFQNTHKYGIYTAASLISNHPSETDTDRKQLDIVLKASRPSVLWRNPYRKEG